MIKEWLERRTINLVPHRTMSGKIVFMDLNFLQEDFLDGGMPAAQAICDHVNAEVNRRDGG